MGLGRRIDDPVLVGSHDAPDVVGQASFQASPGFAGCFAFGDLRQVVEVAAAARHADLRDGNGV